MNKVKIIMSCDDNPFYYSFWNDVSYLWKEIFGFDVTLIYVSDEKNNLLSNKNGEIIQINKVKKVPTYLQAQLARIWYSSKFNNDICVLSDIDMIPLDKNFFNKEHIVKNTNQDCFFHLNPTTREFGQFPICYYCGHGKTYKKIINENSWEDFLLDVINYNFNAQNLGYTLPNHLKDKPLWFSDELFLFSRIKEKKIEMIKNNKIITEDKRINREQLLNINFNINNMFIDCHMPRPFQIYEKQILYLINSLE